MTDWIDDFHEGDLVKYTKGRTSVTAPLTMGVNERLYLEGFEGLPYMDTAPKNGWGVTMVEKAAPPVPTEPGIYLDKDDDIWDMRRTDRGLTLYPGDAPFTRLEPVPVTVQKVINYAVSAGLIGKSGTIQHRIREHFGVK